MFTQMAPLTPTALQEQWFFYFFYFQILQPRYGAIAGVGTQQEIIKRYKTKQLNTQVHWQIIEIQKFYKQSYTNNERFTAHRLLMPSKIHLSAKTECDLV